MWSPRTPSSDPPFYAFEFKVLKNDGLPLSSPVGSTAAVVVNISPPWVDLRKGVLKSTMNALANTTVAGADYADIIKNGKFDGNVVSCIATGKVGTSGNDYVKTDFAHVRKKSASASAAASKVDAALKATSML